MGRDSVSTGNPKEYPMTTQWVCGLLCLMSLVAYSRMPVALNNAGAFLAQMRPSPSRELPAPSRPIAPSAPEFVDTSARAAASLSEYVYLHEMRDMITPHGATARANVCAQ